MLQLSSDRFEINSEVMSAGVKIASLLPAEAQAKVNEALHDKGIALDLSELNPENLNEMLETFGDFTVDVDNDKERVRVYFE